MSNLTEAMNKIEEGLREMREIVTGKKAGSKAAGAGRGAAARKAWATRRKNGEKAPAAKKTAAKSGKKTVKADRGAAARKAWDTRRKNGEKS